MIVKWKYDFCTQITLRMRFVFMFLMVSLTAIQAYANGKIAGKISDEKTGEPIIGATVVVSGTSIGTVTDVDGRYMLMSVPTGTVVVEIKYIGYQQKNIEEVVVKEGEVTEVNAIISEDDKTQLSEVVVTGTLKKESINALYIMQKNNVSVSSGISADIIQRSPDRNTGQVLKRVSGASVKDGKYVVIRGLADRYNLAMVNNALMPSTEPDKKAFSFDVIPSNLIDNIVINKTARPDLPGDFAGGIVQVLTKDVPEENFFNIGLQLGYNTQSTFKDFKSNERTGLTWLGYPGKENHLPSSFLNNRRAYLEQTPGEITAASQQLPNSYKEQTSTALPITSLQASFGNTQRFKDGSRFGTVAGLSYRNTQIISEDFVRGKYEENRIHTSTTEDQTRYATNLAGMANFTYIKGKSKVSFKNLYNKLYDNTYYTRSGYVTSSNQQTRGASSVPSEREVYNTQLQGEHAFGKKNIKLDWNLNYSRMNAGQNDLRTVFYSRTISNYTANDEPIIDEAEPFLSVDDNNRRFFSNQKDNNYGGNVDIELPFNMFNQKQTVKAGVLSSYKTRDFSARVLQYEDASASTPDSIKALPVGEIFDPSNLGYKGTNKFFVNDVTNNTDKYKASGMLNAGYVMLDNNFGDKWRITWGVRFESYTQNLKATNRSGTAIDKTDVFNDILPSLNASYSFSDKSKLRFAASRTVNRPEFREIAPFAFTDFENIWSVSGNDSLKRGNINNFDVRYDFYPNPGEVITIGAFYKGFENPIEVKMDDQSNLDFLIFGYQNASSAYAAGLELEIRKNLSFIGSQKWLENLVAGANLTYIYSRVNTSNIIGSQITTVGTKADRPLQGQSPYLINLSLMYNSPKSGFAASVLYNRIGERIYIVGNASIPTTWEKGRNVIDLQLSKSVLKNKGQLKLTVSDLLNQPYILYWNNNNKDSYQAGDGNVGLGDGSSDRIFQKYTLGTNISLGFTYSLGK